MVSTNLKNFEFRLGRQGIVLFVAGMSFLLLLVFILGVLVGLHIDAYPEKIATVVPEMVRRQLHRPQEKGEKARGEEAKNPKEAVENNVLASSPASLPPKTDDPGGPSVAEGKKAQPPPSA
ncbi:MAG: hypothetical protein L7F78_21960, partial [Syntrophales bacterium LBB04]|nr:hypothetical protein [Syntrophales bacterium LBB04]